MIETARLILRRMEERDAVALAQILNDRRITVNTASIPWPYTLDDAHAHLQRVRAADRRTQRLVMVRKGDPQVGGSIGYEAEPAGHGAELGYCLAVALWGQGLGFEAARAVTEHAFEAAGHERLVASYRHGNEASRRILDRLGFRIVRHGRSFSRGAGREVPVAFVELTRREWRRAR